MNRTIRNITMGLLVLAVVSGCSSNPENSNRRNSQAARAVPVEVKKAVQEEFAVQMSLSGRLEAIQQVEVPSKATGRVQQLLVKVGDQVKSGQPLVVLDGEELRIQMQKAQASMMSAKARYTEATEGTEAEVLAQTANSLADLQNKANAAKVDLDRAQKLFNEGAISTAEVEKARLALASAQTNLENQKQKAQKEKKGPTQASLDSAAATLKQSEADYALSQLNVSNLTIKSPIDGVIGSLTATVGENVSNNAVMAQVINISTMKVTAKASEGQVGQFEPGQSVSVRIPSANMTVNGKISSVSPMADTSKSYPIEIEVANTDLRVKAGMVASVEIKGNPHKAIIVPREAVITKAQSSYVFVVDGDKAKQVTVTTGESDGTKIEILTGLQGGESVVVQGQNTLTANATVAVIDPNQAKNAAGKKSGNQGQGNGAGWQGGQGGQSNPVGQPNSTGNSEPSATPKG
ncbi:efflux RND transporter periplasmic adaptor subunit [Brevibacillus choshinensis]|uniref:efflux RND transporter periplasmic adaptor subunit n=1 Tax=Brevibacillus choshinensis TaxID=54911 RepID=UPI002E1BF2C9|nr:efflux RND transporter periplasmic adaptor subunit [Brevibacillus choshinensis]MED4754423.1 efflux RND transporter periplasmic adaptor subunit [Brevibacillus choshinensis]